MTAFFRDMGDNPFLLTGLLAGLLASLACGVIGPYVVTRRIVFLAGAVAHVAVGGIGAAIFLAARFPGAFGGFRPLYGAAAAAVLSAVAIAYAHHRAGDRVDTLIGALWAVGMAVGILLIKFTPGYQTELMSYLFGNLATVSWGNVRLMTLLVAAIGIVAALFHKRLLAICLDAEQAELQGVNALATHAVLLVLVALTVICLTQVVGLILVIALLSLPAATAGHHVARLASMIWLSTAIALVVTTLPRIAVYGTRISPEPAIVLAAGAVYLASAAVSRRKRRPGG